MDDKLNYTLRGQTNKFGVGQMTWLLQEVNSIKKIMWLKNENQM